MNWLIRWAITAVALMVAAWLLPGIEVREANAWLAVLVTAVLLGLVNALVRPLLLVLSCPLVLVTFGLFIFVVNALMLMLASWLAVNLFGLGFYVHGFWTALFGSLIVSVVSTVLTAWLGDRR